MVEIFYRNVSTQPYDSLHQVAIATDRKTRLPLLEVGFGWDDICPPYC
jgi:hypothetical protein